MAADANTGDETGSHVNAGGDCEAVRGLDGAATREDGVEPEFALELLLNNLAARGIGQGRHETQGGEKRRSFTAHRIKSPRG
jgi:hypothetical protein